MQYIEDIMKKAKIYKPAKTAMQSGNNKNKWLIEFITDNVKNNPLMDWESSNDTFDEIKLKFTSKELAIEYAKKNNIDFEIIEPNYKKIKKKSYADNFTK